MNFWSFLLEALFYLCHAIYLYFWLIWNVGGKIKEKCNGFWGCSRHIKEVFTEFGQYNVDLGDGQWREFRKSLVLLWQVMIGLYVLNQLIRGVLKLNAITFTAEHSAYFRIVSGMIILFVQHGWHSFIVLGIAGLGYFISQWFPKGSKLHPFFTWVFALAVLLFKESYRLKHMPAFRFLVPLFDQRKYGGVYGWQLPANFLVLRMVSYSMDYYWRVCEDMKGKESTSISAATDSVDSVSTSSATDADGHDGSNTCESRCPVSSLLPGTEVPHHHPAQSSQLIHTLDLSDYNFTQYLSYALYAPLYMAGPIITYNDFVRYTHSPQKEESVFYYGLRWLACFALMELLTNKFPFFAIVNSGMLPYLSIGEIAVIFYMILKLMWLKFLIIWRFFRLWAMLDGVLPPENMTKCMSNNRSLEGFWKGWHSSYNKWLVRYIYKPCGGRHSRVWSVWLIFLFVALWHDIETHLLLWGLLNAFFLIVEVYAKKLARESAAVQSLPESLLHMVVVLSGSTYILVLIGVNLIGYSVGMGSISLVLGKLLTWEGCQVLVTSYYFLCVGVKLMLFIEQLQEGSKTAKRKSS